MKTDFDKDSLNALLGDFYACTNIPISLFDTNFECIYASEGIPEYCKIAAGSDTDTENACLECDKQNFAIVDKTHYFHFYTCHAGICELMAPIIYDNVVIAYIMLGRFRDKERIYSSINHVREFAETHGLDAKTLEECYKDLPVFAENVIYSSFNLLKSIICYIYTEKLISMHKGLLPQKIESYIYQNLPTDLLTVDNICKTFFISKRTLYNIFHSEFNDTFCNYVLKKRLQLAKNLLFDTDLPITEVSQQCGFSDYNYFTRTVKKAFGVPPTILRKTHRSAKNQH